MEALKADCLAIGAYHDGLSRVGALSSRSCRGMSSPICGGGSELAMSCGVSSRGASTRGASSRGVSWQGARGTSS